MHWRRGRRKEELKIELKYEAHNMKAIWILTILVTILLDLQNSFLALLLHENIISFFHPKNAIVTTLLTQDLIFSLLLHEI